MKVSKIDIDKQVPLYGKKVSGYDDISIDSKYQIIKNGVNNDFDNILLSLTSLSPTSVAVINVASNIIEGKLSNENLKYLTINENNLYGLRNKFGYLHSQLATQLATYGKCAVRVGYTFENDENGNEKTYIKSIEYLDASKVRYEYKDSKVTGYLLYNEYYGTNLIGKKQNETLRFAPFDIDKAYSQVVESHKDGVPYLGQVLFFNLPTDDVYYQSAAFKAAKESIESEIESNKFFLSSIKNNLKQNGYFEINGDPNSMVTIGFEQDGITPIQISAAEKFNRDMIEVSNTENSSGSLAFWVNNGEGAINYKTIPTNDELIKTFLSNRQENTEQICRAYNINGVLANVAISGKLGNTNEYNSAIFHANLSYKKHQEALEIIYNTILPHFYGYSFTESIKILPNLIQE